MPITERQNNIIEIIKKNQKVSVNELADKFYISESSIRRDLDKLQNDGIIKRVHGGAVIVNGSSNEPPYDLRTYQYTVEKKRISEYAVRFIKEGQTIFLDSSSTVAFLAANLSTFHNITIITDNISTAMDISRKTDLCVYCAGGKIRENSFSTIGVFTQKFFENFNADISFISCRSFHITKGCSEAIEEETHIKRTMIEHSGKTILLCDSSKFNTISTFISATPDKITKIVSDTLLSNEIEEELIKKKISYCLV